MRVTSNVCARDRSGGKWLSEIRIGTGVVLIETYRLSGWGWKAWVMSGQGEVMLEVAHLVPVRVS